MPPSALFPPISRLRLPAELKSQGALLAYLGLTTAELRKIWWYRDRMYRRFEISKAGGKTRTIRAPDDRLKYLQRRIMLLLNQLYPVRNPVHGFVAAKSVKTNASAHLRRRHILNIDIQEFFPSISESRVHGLLSSIGLNADVAGILSRICCHRAELPQGAPSSPLLSNMICFRLDRQLLQFAKSARCIYTRYADDITFSSHQPLAALFKGPVPPPGHFALEYLAPDLIEIFSANGFVINPEKVHYADRNSRRTVTGIKVNEILNVDRRYVRNLRAALFSVNTLGEVAAQEKFEKVHDGRGSLANHLRGKLVWLRHIRGPSDPVFRALGARFNTAYPDLKVDVEASAAEIRERAVWVVEHCEDEKMAQGTAFFLKGTGLVTASHCVEDASQIEVFHPSKPSRRFSVRIGRADPNYDLALLDHSIPATEYYELEPSLAAVQVGDELAALGYPSFAPGDGLNVREGKVSSLTVKHGISLVEVTQKLAQGMSGGPVLNESDKVVGVVHKGGPGEGRDFAVSMDMVDRWLRSEPG